VANVETSYRLGVQVAVAGGLFGVVMSAVVSTSYYGAVMTPLVDCMEALW
jgi:hypothetical protein